MKKRNEKLKLVSKRLFSFRKEGWQGGDPSSTDPTTTTVTITTSTIIMSERGMNRASVPKGSRHGYAGKAIGGVPGRRFRS
ncbi:hypothetical protein C8N40_109157 [Pontibacter mucosus]|uniref:Uncharacterized protein n=1 Tax=Pontibacter mucosus TaxID=1649266 RepID=A0A2T5YEC0_9BACT|nr:hypothetical protein [Pontibacter mucosus]PTX15059.1 hypothetical protein C8N40_109157 [Pontibacter mucosus]